MFNNSEEEKAEIANGCRTAGIGCVDCKKKLRTHVDRVMSPIREKRTFFEKNPSLLQDILREGAVKAKKVAQQTIDEVITAIRFVPRG